MKNLLLAAFAAAAPVSGSQAAQVMAISGVALADSGVQLVSGGCGPAGHRDYYGRCVPNFYRPPPVAYRICPPGFHPGGYGRCFPNF